MATAFVPVATEDEEVSKKEIEDDNISVKSTIYDHLGDNSVVGIAKLSQAKYKHQYILWSIFMILMLIALIWGLFNTIAQYRQYEKTIQFSKKILKTEFPAITVCSQTPFSKNALNKWKTGAIPSPSEFSQKMRNRTRWFWKTNSSRLADMYFHSDVIGAYYSSLTYKDAVAMSHKISDLFMFCTVYVGHRKITNIMTRENPCYLDIRLISHVKYFNCYIFQVKDKSMSKHVNKVSLLVNLNHTINLNHPSLKEAFAGDLGDHAEGLRISLHENNIRPRIDEYGVNVEPDKNVEFEYREESHILTSTPNDGCLSNDEISWNQIVDLKNTFNYSAHDCKLLKVSEEMMKYCGCQRAAYIRPKMNTPYCTGLFLHDLERGRECMRKKPAFEVQQKNEALCAKRCEHTRYRQHASYSKCTATKWLLDWWKINLGMKHVKGDVSKSSELQRLLDEVDVLDGSETGKTKNIAENIIHLTVKRSSTTIDIMTEKRLLDFTEMMSQIGGLLGLYLGISFAFAIEMLVLAGHVVKSRFDRVRRYFQNRKNVKKDEAVNSQNETAL